MLNDPRSRDKGFGRNGEGVQGFEFIGYCVCLLPRILARRLV